MGNFGFLKREAKNDPVTTSTGRTRRQELRNASFWPSSLFKSQLVKEGEAPQKILRVSNPTRISPFVVPTRKEAPTGNTPMGAIPPKQSPIVFLKQRKTKLQRLQGSTPQQGKGAWKPLFPMTPPKPPSVHQ